MLTDLNKIISETLSRGDRSMRDLGVMLPITLDKVRPPAKNLT